MTGTAPAPAPPSPPGPGHEPRALRRPCAHNAPTPARPRLGSGGAARAGAEAAAGAILLGLMAVVGCLVAAHRGPTLVDRWVSVVPARHGGGLLVSATRLGSPLVLVTGSLAGAVSAWRRSHRRALALAVGPVLAVGLSEVLVKPLVERRLEGTLSFPSGTVVAVAALATVAVVSTPAPWRWATGAVAALVTTAVAVAVVALGWHYPTDALGGAALGAGVVLLTDGATGRVGLPSVHGAGRRR